jgi:ABC-type transport system involved in cytochrome bd biosynthesis fused ATPase/permease subunit
LVTHKLNPAKESDQIIILNDGTFEGIGTHDELFVNNHLYAKAFSEYEY